MLKKYLPYVLIVAAFILGKLLSPGPDKEERERLKKEVNELKSGIKVRDSKYESLQTATANKIKRMTIESLQTSEALKRQDLKIRTLTKRLEKINLSMATDSQLDSIVSGLYPKRKILPAD